MTCDVDLKLPRRIRCLTSPSPFAPQMTQRNLARMKEHSYYDGDNETHIYAAEPSRCCHKQTDHPGANSKSY